MPKAPARQEAAAYPGLSSGSKMLHPGVCAEQYLIHLWVLCGHSCGEHPPLAPLAAAVHSWLWPLWVPQLRTVKG